MTWTDEHGQPRVAFNHTRNLTKATESLLGICKGLLADRQLNNQEIVYLDTWIRDNDIVLGDWPGSVIAQRVRAVLAEGVIGADEVADLADTLSAICGIDLDQGIVSGLSTRAPAEPTSEVVFKGRAFCFTGRFIYGPRHTLEQEVKNRGGWVQSRVNKSLDYLVIGALASRDWAHTSHGRKIESAKNHQKAGRPMVILEEETWAACL
ncbi:MAG: BRCT domain-containing protein [Nitrococcus sp.]|nr:BRCT domain-containing protein [Nitrococcus sp.]